MRDCVVLLVAFLLLGAARVPAAPAPPRFGINHDFVWTPDAEIPGLIQTMKDAGVQAVRVPIRWTVAEPERGKWTWDKIDSVIRQIREAKIEVLATLMSVPAWASGVDPKKVEGFWDCFSPSDMKDWAEFARRCALRYKDHIRYWEIWNEENGPDFYKPMPDAKQYVLILKTANRAIKAVDPKAVVLLGGLQMNGIIPNPWLPVKVENFLQRIYDAGGRPYFDVVNTHPYVIPSKEQGASYAASLTRDTVEVMKKNGDGAKPLWITETGTYTGHGVTEDMQAEHLTGIYRELYRIPEVKSIFWFTLRDYGKSICGGEDTMGVTAADGRRKPAFDAYRKLAAR